MTKEQAQIQSEAMTSQLLDLLYQEIEQLNATLDAVQIVAASHALLKLGE